MSARVMEGGGGGGGWGLPDIVQEVKGLAEKGRPAVETFLA